MATKGYHLSRDGVERTGQAVDNLLNKIEDLENATTRTDGTMSKEDKNKLDNYVADHALSLAEIDEICSDGWLT